jgi:hypothetical protein
MYNYLFGEPATPRKPSATGCKEWFILGAYPSALHARWKPHKGKGFAAVAVADEPEPFWEGKDQAARLERWAEMLPWNSDWGEISSPGDLNGSSGARLRELVLAPLGIGRGDAWITDCLDIYHESEEATERFNEPETASLLAELHIRDRVLPLHPDEGEIVAGAQIDRLRSELNECQPEIVITLGNAALRVLGKLTEGPTPLARLSPDPSYGKSHSLLLPGRSAVRLLPLAHPFAPDLYQQAHAAWLQARLRDA